VRGGESVTDEEQELVIRRMTFDAAHYLKGHPKCGVIHGHTYLIVDLKVRFRWEFVDFADLKKVVKEIDHVLLAPKNDHRVWLSEAMSLLLKRADIKMPICFIDGPTTVENIAKYLAKQWLRHKGVTKVSFTLYEGLNAGVKHSEKCE